MAVLPFFTLRSPVSTENNPDTPIKGVEAETMPTRRVFAQALHTWTIAFALFLFLTCAVLPQALAARFPGGSANLKHSPITTVPSEMQAYIVVDTNQNRLTLYESGVPVHIYRVGLGRPSSPTPVGEWKITDKQRDWGGGFGTRWMRINVPWGIYGIHGTNKPHLVGGDVSSGCIRMRNQDVEQLYERVGVGTPVVIEGNPLRHSRRLEYGNIGSDVLLVQDRLKRLGYYRGPRDGKFGTVMEEALKKFEAAKGLPVDGVVGIADYRALGLEE